MTKDALKCTKEERQKGIKTESQKDKKSKKIQTRQKKDKEEKKTKKEKKAKKTKRQKDKGGWGDWLDEQNIWGKSISFAKYDNTPFSLFIGADCTDGDATIWTTKLALAPLQQLAAFADRVGRYHFLNFLTQFLIFRCKGCLERKLK